MLSKQTFKKLIAERKGLIGKLNEPSDKFDLVVVSLPKLTLKVCIGVKATDGRRARDVSSVPFVYLSPTDDEKCAVVDWLMERCKGYHFKISKRYGGHVAEYYLKADWDYWYKLDKEKQA